MSEISIDFQIEFADARARDLFYKLFASYDHRAASQEAYRKQLDLLESVGIDGSQLFNANTTDCEVSVITPTDDAVLRFHLSGGVHGGSRFYEQLLPLLLQADPINIYALAFNDQVCEITAYVYDHGEETRYFTGEGGDSDDILFDILGRENALDLLAQLYADGRLTMPVREPQQVDGIDVSILENEDLYDAHILRYLKSGVLFGLALFLAGWLLLDYFWTALVGGVLSAFAVTFTGAFKLQAAKDRYDQQADRMIRDEAKDTGITEDQALALMQYLEQSLARAEESAK